MYIFINNYTVLKLMGHSKKWQGIQSIAVSVSDFLSEDQRVGGSSPVSACIVLFP